MINSFTYPIPKKKKYIYSSGAGGMRVVSVLLGGVAVAGVGSKPTFAKLVIFISLIYIYIYIYIIGSIILGL